MEPTTAAMIAKAAIAVGTNKKVWTGIASVIAALCLPFIFILVGVGFRLIFSAALWNTFRYTSNTGRTFLTIKYSRHDTEIK